PGRPAHRFGVPGAMTMPRLIGAMIVLAGFALGPVAGPLGPLGTWLGVSPAAAQTDLDGHGPDAWRVTGVAPGDVLNARMGPGTQYPVIETFAHNERDLRQITCVPFYGITHFMAMSEAERAALPPRWCLMRHADLMRAGWVAQRYLTPDDTESVAAAAPEPPPAAG